MRNYPSQNYPHVPVPPASNALQLYITKRLLTVREADPQLRDHGVEAERVTRGPKALPLRWPPGEWPPGEWSQLTLPLSSGLWRLALLLSAAEDGVFLKKAWEHCHRSMS